MKTSLVMKNELGRIAYVMPSKNGKYLVSMSGRSRGNQMKLKEAYTMLKSRGYKFVAIV